MSRTIKKKKKKYGKGQPKTGSKWDYFRCPYCQGEMKLITSLKMYGQDYGTMLWVCEHHKVFDKSMKMTEHCDTYVGCHKGTVQPMGSPANAELRKLRMYVHELFDRIWKSGQMDRDAAYAWLSNVMKVSKEKCHIGMFSKTQCTLAISILENRSHAIMMQGLTDGILPLNMLPSA